MRKPSSTAKGGKAKRESARRGPPNVSARKRGGSAAGARGVSRPEMGLLSAVKSLTAQARHLREQAATLRAARPAVVERKSSLTELYDLVPVPYLLLSATAVILGANGSALEMLGADRDHAVGRPFVAFLEASCVRKVLENILACRAGQAHVIEATLRTANGPRPVHVTIQRGGSGDTTYRAAIVDLSEIRRLEEQRRRAEEDRAQSVEAERTARAASEAKDEFLAMLSHELRTPLTPILAASDTLMLHGALPAQIQVAIDIIRRNVKAEARLIDDLLDVARINRNTLVVERRPVDLRRLLSDVTEGWHTSLAERNIRLHVEMGSEEHWMSGDVSRLAQVFRNLLSNAAKFSDSGGRITVRAEGRPGGLRVVMADNGIGIAPEVLEVLFSPFIRSRETLARGGLGLGLVICKGIVEAHGGSLSIASPGSGQGTTVTVDLPTIAHVELGEVPEKKSIDTESPRSGNHRRVLLVEDDADTAQMLAFLLESEGYPVAIAHSLFEARHLADSCDLIVSDIALPDGSGLELIRDLLEHGPRPAIALSGYGSAADVDRSLQAGFSEHLTKPVDLDRLVAAVRRLAAS